MRVEVWERVRRGGGGAVSAGGDVGREVVVVRVRAKASGTNIPHQQTSPNLIPVYLTSLQLTWPHYISPELMLLHLTSFHLNWRHCTTPDLILPHLAIIVSLVTRDDLTKATHSLPSTWEVHITSLCSPSLRPFPYPPSHALQNHLSLNFITFRGLKKVTACFPHGC